MRVKVWRKVSNQCGPETGHAPAHGAESSAKRGAGAAAENRASGAEVLYSGSVDLLDLGVRPSGPSETAPHVAVGI